MRIRLSLLFLFFTSSIFAQITWEPAFPTESDSITITFDATKGNQGLKDYAGDVYAHTGVITNLSTSNSDWKHVKTNWGVNTPETKLIRISPNIYQFKIKPNSRAFYGVTGNEKIEQIAFVFRSGVQVGGSYKEGKTETNGDIFLPISEVGLNVSITSPENEPYFLELNDSVTVSAAATLSTHLALYVNNVLVAESDSNQVVYNLKAAEYGKKRIKAVATGSGSEEKSDSTYVMVNSPITTEALPSGVEPGINYMDNTSATLCLQAPGKDFVYVIGDFNNWEADPAYYMKRTPDDQYYWVQLSGLESGKEYIFQYLVDGQLRVADPYTDKVSDPWNDKFISNTVYPGLIQYPEGKTSEPASVLQTGQTPFQWTSSEFERPEKSRLVIYELLVRDFLSRHDYKTLKDTLNYFKRLGVNAIELMPINEFEGNESWGYNPSFYFAPDKYYGPKNDLKAFIDACHENGIAVIMDIVLNHAYGTNPMVRLYFQNGKPSAENPWFNQQSNFQNPDAQWGYDFNHESSATQYFVDRTLKYWLTEYKFDGFRFDFTKGFGNNIKSASGDPWGSIYDADRIRLLKRMVDRVWEYDSTAIMIFEHLSDNAEEKELANHGILLWGNMNYQYNEASMGYASDLTGASYKSRSWNEPNLVAYMESHDEERLMFKNIKYGNSSGSYSVKDTSIALNRMKLVSAFFYTIPGPKMIWQFGELGYDVSIDFNGRVGNKPIRWQDYSNPERNNLYKTNAALIALKQYDAFSSTDFTLSLNVAVKRIKINHPSMNVDIIGNFSVQNLNINPMFQQTGTWYDYFSGDSIDVTDVNANILLAPGEFHIYTTAKLPTPEPGILTDVIESDYSVIPEKYNLAQNYPNPFNPSTSFEFNVASAGMVTLKIYDILGKEVATVVNEELSPGTYNVNFNAVNLSSGVYFYTLSAGDFISTKKMILMK